MKLYTRIFCICVLVVLAISGSFVLPVQAAETLGQSRTFFVSQQYDQYSRHTLTATLRHQSVHLNIYTDDFYWDRLSSRQQGILLDFMSRLANEFDNKSYPTETSFWGAEPNPGIDNDPRITILLEALRSGTGGYFDSIHNNLATAGTNSNEREMIFLSFDALAGNLIGVFLGHEFQHLISSNQKEILRNVSEEVWLNEARSEYTASLLNQNTPYSDSTLARRVQNFVHTPSDSLMEWANVPTDYGIASVFAEYLVGRFGNRILNESLRSPYAGIDSLNRYWAANNYRERFTDVFLDWMVASYRNDSRAGAAYTYAKPELQTIHVAPTFQGTATATTEATLSASVKYWQPVWYDVAVGDPTMAGVRLVLTTQGAQHPAAQAILSYNDGSYEVRRIDPIAGTGTTFLPVQQAGKQLTNITVAATYTLQESGFSSSLAAYPFTVQATLIDDVTLQAGLKATAATQVTDGALIKRNNAEPEIYVVRDLYKRYLRPDIIALYGHLNPANTIPLDGNAFDSYRSSNYVRYIGDPKVYAVWPDGTKHWLRMTAQRFTDSGRDWNSIFIINQSELNAYRTGPDITQ